MQQQLREGYAHNNQHASVKKDRAGLASAAATGYSFHEVWNQTSDSPGRIPSLSPRPRGSQSRFVVLTPPQLYRMGDGMG